VKTENATKVQMHCTTRFLTAANKQAQHGDIGAFSQDSEQQVLAHKHPKQTIRKESAAQHCKLNSTWQFTPFRYYPFGGKPCLGDLAHSILSPEIRLNSRLNGSQNSLQLSDMALSDCTAPVGRMCL
jgi:hypothetical protein